MTFEQKPGGGWQSLCIMCSALCKKERRMQRDKGNAAVDDALVRYKVQLEQGKTAGKISGAQLSRAVRAMCSRVKPVIDQLLAKPDDALAYVSLSSYTRCASFPLKRARAEEIEAMIAVERNTTRLKVPQGQGRKHRMKMNGWKVVEASDLIFTELDGPLLEQKLKDYFCGKVPREQLLWSRGAERPRVGMTTEGPWKVSVAWGLWDDEMKINPL